MELEEFDLSKAIQALKFKSLKEVPGFPGPIPHSQQVPLGNGVSLEELSRCRFELENGFNIKTTLEDFDHFFRQWEAKNKLDALYGRWPQATQ